MTDTIRTRDDLINNLFQNGQAQGSITAQDIRDLIVSLEMRNGWMDYNDASTASTPLSLTANTWTDVPNNGLGSFTNKAYKPANVTELLDTSTGYLDFSDLALGAEVFVRNDLTVTPQTNNALFEARYLLGTGAGQYALQFWSERLDNGSGIGYQRAIVFKIYMGDTNTQGNAGRLQVRLSTAGTLVNAGTYISVSSA